MKLKTLKELSLLYLQVEVSDLLGVQVENSVQDLLQELSGLLFAQRLLLCQEVKELTASNTKNKKKRRRAMRGHDLIRGSCKSLRSNQPEPV